jgi:hypothetical protein
VEGGGWVVSALDWSIENRGDIGHAVIDVAPAHDADYPCYSGWYARQLGLHDFHDTYEADHWVKPLLDKMASAGVLVKTGGQYSCECGRTHQEPTYYRLALDRVEARERWDEHVTEPRWWALTPRAKSTGRMAAHTKGTPS